MLGAYVGDVRARGVAAVGLVLVAGVGCSSGSPEVMPRPTATPLPVASLSALDPVELPRAGTARCLIGDPGDPDFVEVAVTRDDAGLTEVSWSGAASVGGEADLGWYLLATAAEGGAAYQVGATSTADGVSAFVAHGGGGDGQVMYLTGDDADDDVVTVDEGQITVTLDPEDTPGLEGVIEWSAIARADGREVYSCSGV